MTPWATVLAAVLLGCNTESDEEPKPPAVECQGDGADCSRLGTPGTCIGERCILPSGYCSYDIDCDDGNTCTQVRCIDATCVSESLLLSCEVDEMPGACTEGHCVPALPAECLADDQCALPEAVCKSASCIQGTCELQADPDGDACELPSGLEGVCAGAVCVSDLSGSDVSNPQRCVKRGVYYYGFYQTYQDCTAGLSYRLPAAELDEAADVISGRIAKDLRYDVHVVLVPVADGGYNIVMHNKHDRSTVEGLVDPSFVAFSIAGYTAGTSWRSRQLQIWLDPYDEGWAISTAGSRFAMQKGRDRSSLGWLGVVDVPAFRNWLTAEFEPMERPDPRPGQTNETDQP